MLGKRQMISWQGCFAYLACLLLKLFLFSLLSPRKECTPWILYQSRALPFPSFSTYCDNRFLFNLQKICCPRSALCRLFRVASLTCCNPGSFFSLGVLSPSPLHHIQKHHLEFNWGFGEKRFAAAVSSRIFGQVMVLPLIMLKQWGYQ